MINNINISKIIKQMEEEEKIRIENVEKGIKRGCEKCSNWNDYYGCNKCESL